MLFFRKWMLPAALAALTLLSACGNSAGAGKTAEETKTEGTSAVAGEAATEKEGAKTENTADDSKFAVSDDSLTFTAKNLDKEDIDSSIFADKDLTVLNVWGTFCGPCINEMPELAAWAKEMPENVQIVGLVADISGESDDEHIALAKKIMEQSSGEFTNIIPGVDFVPLLSNVVGVPTTYFINKEGKIVGRPIVGAQVPKYKTFVEEYLKSLE